MTKKSKEPLKLQTFRGRFHERIYVVAAAPGCKPPYDHAFDLLRDFSPGAIVGEYRLVSISQIEKVAKVMESEVKA